jgi:hypothetical protein
LASVAASAGRFAHVSIARAIATASAADEPSPAPCGIWASPTSDSSGRPIDNASATAHRQRASCESSSAFTVAFHAGMLSRMPPLVVGTASMVTPRSSAAASAG